MEEKRREKRLGTTSSYIAFSEVRCIELNEDIPILSAAKR